MVHLRPHSILPLVLTLGGCSPTSSDADAPKSNAAPAADESEVPSTPDAETKAETKAETETEAETKAAPDGVDAAEPNPDDVEPSAPPAGPPSALRLAALRGGPIELLQSDGGVMAMLEGEPLSMIDGVPTRQPGANRGLESSFNPLSDGAQTLAFTGDPGVPGGAWLTTTHYVDRTAPDFTVYQRLAQGWQPLQLGKSPLVSYYAAFAQRDGARFALKVWSSDPDEYWEDGEPGAEAHARAFQRKLAKAKPAWVALSKTTARAPKIPRTLLPFRAVTTDDHSIYALASKEPNSDRPVVLLWPQGTVEAQTIPLPDLPAGLGEPMLSSSGSWALVTGYSQDDEDGVYLAVGTQEQWERIPVVIPDRPENAPNHLFGAARTPTGEIWVAIGDRWSDDTPGVGVWRRTADGAWHSVPYPKIDDAALAGEPEWVRNAPRSGGAWTRADRPEAITLAQPRALFWGAGGIWVTVEAGNAFPGADLYKEFPRTVLLTTTPGTAPAVLLPSAPQLIVERHNARASSMKPGDGACEQVSLFLDPMPAPSEQATIAEALLALDHGTLDGSIDQVYVGRHDGKEILVAAGKVEDEASARALTAAVAEASKAEATLDCQIPPLVRMVKER